MKNKPNSDTVVILDQASGYLQIDMLEAYAAQFKNRAIVAGSIVQRGTPLSSDIKWHRITKYNRSTTSKRLFTWAMATIQMLWIVLRYYRKAHIVAITNPPFSIFVPWILGCKSYDVIVYDMYPDALVHYGYFNKSNWLFKIWKTLNIKVYKKATRVITLTTGMSRLTNQYMPKNKKAEVIPLWSEASDFKPVDRIDNKILSDTDSRDKFVIVYSGNLGKTHPVEKLVELAEHLDSKKFSIIIIGEGDKKKILESLISHKKLPHVFLLPWQPIEFLSHNLHAGHINAVTLDEQAADLCIPSKTFNILSIGNPILGICSEKSSLGELIQQNKCGIIGNLNEIKHLASEIINLEKNRTLYIEMCKNSRITSKKFTKQNAKKYIS